MEQINLENHPRLAEIINSIVIEKLKQEKRKARKRKIFVLFAFSILVPVTIWATSITKPFTFTDGATASASEVNSNFDTLYTKVNELDGRSIPKVYSGSASSDTTLTLANQDVPGTSLTLVDVGKYVLIANAHFFWSSDGDLISELMINGSPISGQIIANQGVAGEKGTYGQNWLITTTSANSIAKLVTRKSSGVGGSILRATDTTLTAIYIGN